MWVKTKKQTKTGIYTQSVLLAATSNALWHFPSDEIETIWAKTTRPKSAWRLSLDVSRIHPANISFYSYLLSQFFIRANIIWHILETHYMEEENKKKLN